MTETPGCTCGHGQDVHFQDGCVDKSGGGYFCWCMEYEAVTPDTAVGAECVKAVDEYVAKLPRLAPAITQQFGPIPPPRQVEAWLSDGRPVYLDDLDAPGVYRISSQARASAGRHYRREHWLKRLFLRGR